jgi:putative transposase
LKSESGGSPSRRDWELGKRGAAMMENRRKRAAGKVAVEVVGRQQRLGLGEVMLDVRADFIELLAEGGKAIAAALFEEDMGRLCGERYARKEPEAGQARRWGQQRGQVVLGGRKVNLDRPRARLGNEEVALPSYLRLQQEDPLGERALAQMLVGVSTRNYRRSLEPLSGGLAESAVDRSSVSRRFVLKTEEQLDAALKKPLGETHWAGVYIDGLHFAEHVVIVVLGVDASGKKHVLGLREGSTENSTLCKELLSNLVERGLPADRALLTIIDGGKGLRKAVREVFGQHEVVQRCQVHKMRNVLDQLPEAKRSSVRAAMTQAYNAPSYDSALTQLKNLVRVLAKDHPSAAESLREGLEETLTVKRLGLTGALEKSLRTTNPAESLNEGMRRVSRRVKRWRDGGMVLRWAAASALEAEERLRRLKGYKSMPVLLAALHQHDAALAIDIVRRSA